MKVVCNRDTLLRSRSLEQWTKVFDIEKGIGEIGEFESDIVVFDDMLDYNQDATGLF